MNGFRRIALGSTQPAKLGAARSLLASFGWRGELVPLAVASGVPAQPVGQAQTRLGALRRARRSLLAGRADLGLGMEGGVVWRRQACWLINWCVVAGADGRDGQAQGVSLRLPPAVAGALRAGGELSDAVRSLEGVAGVDAGLGAVGLCTAGLLSRQSVWEAALACALAPFLRPELY